MRKRILLVFVSLVTLVCNAQYRDVKLPETPQQVNYKSYESENSGFWCGIDLEGGSSVMEHKTNMQYANLSCAGGYRFSEFIRLGVGIGIRYYVHNANVRNTDSKFGIPIFANMRGNFISAYDRDGVPFWSFNIGGITNEGFFASPTIGYSFGGLRHNFQIGVCYTITCFKNNTLTNSAYSYFGLKFGYEF